MNKKKHQKNINDKKKDVKKKQTEKKHEKKKKRIKDLLAFRKKKKFVKNYKIDMLYLYLCFSVVMLF